MTLGLQTTGDRALDRELVRLWGRVEQIARSVVVSAPAAVSPAPVSGGVNLGASSDGTGVANHLPMFLDMWTLTDSGVSVTSGDVDVPALKGFRIGGAATTGHYLRGNALGTRYEDSAILAGDLPTGIDALKIGAGSVNNTKFGYLSNVTSDIQAQINAKEPTIAAGTSLQYWRGDKSWQTLDTSAVPENSNLYFTFARVRSTLLTGLSLSNTAILSTDQTIDAFGKLQGQINNLQPLDGDLTTIAAIGAGTGHLKRTGTNAWSIGQNVDSTDLVSFASMALGTNLSAAQWTTAGIGFKAGAQTYTDSTSNTTVSHEVIHAVGVPILSSTNAATFTRASTWYLAGPPTAGGSAVITNPFVLYMATGLVYSGGDIRTNTSTKVGIGIGGITAGSGQLQLAGGMSANAWGLAAIGFRVDAQTYTDSNTADGATVTNVVCHSIARPTIAATNASAGVTYTHPATLYLANSPAAGSHVNLTNPYTIWVDDGDVRFDGGLAIGKTAKPAFALDVSGVIAFLGTTGNTLRWNAGVAAPGTTVGVATTNRYGGNTNICGDPTIWVLVNVAGVDYKIPAY